MINTKKPTLRLPDDFSWEQTVALLLDAVQVKKLLPRLFEWNPKVIVEVIYLRTRFAQFRDLSPCLVRLKEPSDPILEQFLAHVGERWGYLLACDAPWEQVAAHWRWLASVEHPSGEEMLLRIADPAVAHAVFSDTGSSTTTLFGPCHRVIVVNAVNDGWNHYTRAGERPAPNHAALYRLSERQVDLLNEASFDKRVTELYGHMGEFFPDYRTDLQPQQRWQHLRSLAKRAVELGFESESDIWLYANAHGFLGEQRLADDPEIASLLNPASPLPPSTRIAMITTLVERRSHP
jgi:hypothetical protein